MFKPSVPLALVLFALPAAGQELDITTTYASGNGQSGNMLDLQALEDIVLSRVDCNIDPGATTVEIWWTPGGYKGKNTDQSQWNLLGSAAVTGQGEVATGSPVTPIPIQLDLEVKAGEKIGLYITTTGTTINYTNGKVEGAQLVSDGNVTIFEGIGVPYPFGSPFTPRIWNGTLYYYPGSSGEQHGYTELQAIGGPAKDAEFGTALGRVADLDSDGIDDLAVGLPGATSGKGEVRYVSGKDGSILMTSAGQVSTERFGSAVASLGNIDQDPFDEVLIGAPESGLLGEGRAYVFTPGQAVPDLVLVGTLVSKFGTAVAAVPDANGDGVGDFAVGAPGRTTGAGIDVGGATLYSGLDGSVLHDLEATLPAERFGSALAGLGDVDGDGRGDWAVGAPTASEDPYAVDRRGRVAVHSGATGALVFEVWGTIDDGGFGSTLLGVGDVDGDGRDDLAVGAPDVAGGTGVVYLLSGNGGALLWSDAGTVPGKRYGTSLAALGDVNGDGHADLAVGAPAVDKEFGYVRVLRRSDGQLAAELVQGSVSTRFGQGLAGLGDLNGDGLADLAVGSPNEFAGQSGSGRVRLLTTAGSPVMQSVSSVLCAQAGEVVIEGQNLLGATVYLDDVVVPSTAVSPVELRIPVQAELPGQIHDLRVVTALGTLEQPGGLRRHPTLDAAPTLTLGGDLQIEIDNGQAGIFVLALSDKVFGSPIPFTSQGWFYGLELSGVWTIAAGTFTQAEPLRTIVFPNVSSPNLVDETFWFQAMTTQVPLGTAGFTRTVPVTVVL